MKRSLLAPLLLCAFALNSPALDARLSPLDQERLANAIYRAEGGARAKSPYGILSIKVRDEKHARQICLTSIRNNWKRWQDHVTRHPSSPVTFIDFMADRWCPIAADPIGNANWKRNVKALTK